MSWFSSDRQRLRSLEEEIAHIKERAELKTEAVLPLSEGEGLERIKEATKEYAKAESKSVISPSYEMPPTEVGSFVLDLAPDPHDKQIEKLVALMHERGIKNVFSVIEKMDNPHIADDFHRFLVQYIKAGQEAEGFKESNELWKPSRMTLYEISLPTLSPEDKNADFRKFASGMEQFYAGMILGDRGLSSGEKVMTIEIANANGSDEFVFYASVPDKKKDLFEKQITAIFPGIRIKEEKNDYNIFNIEGVSAGAYATVSKNPAFPVKTYDEFELDPMNVLLNSFDKIDRDGEGASLQIVFTSAGNEFVPKWQKAVSELEKGVHPSVALDIPYSTAQAVVKGVGDVFSSFFSVPGPSPKNKKKEEERAPEAKVSPEVIGEIKKKIASPTLAVNMRILSSARDRKSAEEILEEVESAFNQFGSVFGAGFSWMRVEGSRLRELAKEFTWRIYSARERLLLNVKECASILHFPSVHNKQAPQIKSAKTSEGSAPPGMPSSGTLLGVNSFHGKETLVFLEPEDRLRHFYVIGQTGTGKTTLLKNMIVQDIKEGRGVCMIDPHGSDINDVLASVPKERAEDVIYFDPANTARPMALNMLEYDRRFPEQKTFVVNEMLSIFDKLFDMKVAGGPMFEQYFRNAVLLVIEDPDSGNTLLDVSRVLANKAFREKKLGQCRNPIVSQFWREIAEKAGGEASLQNIVPYITSKFDNFLSNEIMRPIIAQEKSSLNLRDIMDGKKILLVNLAKGRLGDLNSYLIGLVLVGKILMSALSRADSPGADLPPFYLYIDEFQNITTPSISAILSEARKYKLSLSVAHQFIGQLDQKIKEAVFGNVGSMACFRVGPEDSEFMAKQFAPVFSPQDIINLENRRACVRVLAKGVPMRPFGMETLPPEKGDTALAERLKEMSALKYGRPRDEVEAEIALKYQQKTA